MITLNLDEQLSGHLFQFLIVFTRLGSIIMLLPGIGEAYVAPRIRLLFALAVSFLLLPVLMPLIPKIPDTIPSLVLLIMTEVLIGVFVGSFLRLLITTIETAGAVIAVQIGLSNAMILNPALASQSALPSAFLGIGGVTLLFLTGLDHVMLKGMVNVYDLFPVGGPMLTGDMTQAYIQMLGKSFAVGVQLSAPFLVIGTLLFVALGFMQRMMAQVQLFLVVLPVQILGGAILLASTVGMIFTVWLRFFDSSIAGLLVR